MDAGLRTAQCWAGISTCGSDWSTDCGLTKRPDEGKSLQAAGRHSTSHRLGFAAVERGYVHPTHYR